MLEFIKVYGKFINGFLSINWVPKKPHFLFMILTQILWFHDICMNSIDSIFFHHDISNKVSTWFYEIRLLPIEVFSLWKDYHDLYASVFSVSHKLILLWNHDILKKLFLWLWVFLNKLVLLNSYHFKDYDYAYDFIIHVFGWILLSNESYL